VIGTIERCPGCSLPLADGRHAEDCALANGSIPRRIYLPRSAMLEGFQQLGGLRFFVRGILRTYGAKKEDVKLVTESIDKAIAEREPLELSIKVGSHGTWTMVLS